MKSKTRNILTCKLVVTQNQLCDVRQGNCKWTEKEVSLWTWQLRTCIYFSGKKNGKVILSIPVTWFMCIVTNKQEKLKTEGHIHLLPCPFTSHFCYCVRHNMESFTHWYSNHFTANPWKSSWLNTGKYNLPAEWKQSLKGTIRSQSSVFKKKSITTVPCAIAGYKGRKGREEKRRNSAPTLSFSQNLSTSSTACTTSLCRARGEGKKPIESL